METKLLSFAFVAIVTLGAACSRSEADTTKSSDGTSEGQSSEGDDKKAKGDDKKADHKKTRSDDKKADEGGDSGGDPSDGIGACDDWKKKVSSCEVLKKSAASLIEKTAVVWRKKGMSKDEIETDCKEKTESLPKVCR
jgi:hypothetical protein